MNRPTLRLLEIQRTITILYIMGLASSICILCIFSKRTISGHRINHRNGTFIAITRALNVPKEIVFSCDCVLFLPSSEQKNKTYTHKNCNSTTQQQNTVLHWQYLVERTRLGVVFICVPFCLLNWCGGFCEHVNSIYCFRFAIGLFENVWMFFQAFFLLLLISF